MKILIVESDENTSKKLCKTFAEYGGGSVCEVAGDLDRGLEIGLAGKYDFIIVGHGGNRDATKNMITKLRAECSIPLVVLLPDDDTTRKVVFLNSGADACLRYDCEEAELLAVIGAVLRRYYRNFGINVYEFKNLKINYFEKSVKIDGEDVGVVAKTYDLIEYLTRHKGIIVSKETLFNRVWGFDSETAISVVEVYISKLRKLLEKGGLSAHLQTVKNAGYCWSEK